MSALHPPPRRHRLDLGLPQERHDPGDGLRIVHEGDRAERLHGQVVVTDLGGELGQLGGEASQGAQRRCPETPEPPGTDPVTPAQ
jgi:hypothetical protein